jgi:hypothetical protein
MPVAEPAEGPEVIPSPVDADYECVRVDGPHAEPPTVSESDLPRLCPEGYVPRLKRRHGELDGKRVRTQAPPDRNPNPP